MSAQCASLQIAADHPSLPGHFPGNPIVPGVVLLDEALYAIEQSQPDGAIAGGWQIASVKFHRVVRPGDRLQLQLQTTADGAVRFELHHDAELIASGVASWR